MNVDGAGVFRRITSSSVREVLQQAVADARAMTHSWLFTGPPGSGRSIAADVFATALVCPQGGCGTCEHCRSAQAGTHADIVWVRTQGVVIRVDDIRDVIRDAASMPTVAHRRVIIIENADRLTPQAANSLLKSVEEPSEHTVFILCAPSTDPQDIAITLRSRCRHVYIPTPSPEAVRNVLLADARLGLTEAQAEWAASVSGGHIGRARHLASQEQARAKRATALRLPGLVYEPTAAYTFASQLVKHAEQEAAVSLKEINEAEVAELESSVGMGSTGRGVARMMTGTKGQFKELEDEQKRRYRRRVADSLDLALIDIAGLYRDAMLIAAEAEGEAAPVGGFQHPDMEGTSRELARRNRPEALLRCIDAVMECRATLSSTNVPPAVALSALAGRLRECCGVAS